MANKISPWYPGAMSLGESRYVFFNSLNWKDFPAPAAAYMAETYLLENNSLMTDYDGDNVVSINSVLSYLDTIIASERSKESSFIDFLKSNKNLDLNIPSIEQDWSDFVKEVQRYLVVGRDDIQNLEAERKRLQDNIDKNKENYKKLQEGEYTIEDYNRAQRGYRRSANYKTTEQMKKVTNFLNGDSKSRTGKAVLNYILKNFGKELITLDSNGNIVLNQRELYATILGASQIILSEYNRIVPELQELERRGGKNEPKRYDITRDLENVLNTETAITDQLKETFKRINRLPFLAKNLAKDYEIKGSVRNNKDYQALADKQKRLQNQSDEINEEIGITSRDIQKYFSIHNITSLFDNSFKVSQTKSAISEIQDSVIHLFRGAFHSSRVGGSLGKTDALIGYIHINAESALSSNKMKALGKQLERISEKMQKLEGTFSKTNTLEYYQQQQKNWDETIKSIDKLLTELKESYGILSECFILEDSAKSYESLLVDKGINENGQKWESFSGGSIGADITEQINKIDALADLGGISLKDRNWLINACINAGPSMIGQTNRKSLEDYFSTMAAILMFDNQLEIVQEAFKPQPSQTNVKQIHLFYVNNGYYPLSYILNLTKEYLQLTYQECLLAVESHGAEAQLTGFVPHPPKFHPIHRPLTKEEWDNVSKEALSTTQIKVTFLGGFLDLLNKLLDVKI